MGRRYTRFFLNNYKNIARFEDPSGARLRVHRLKWEGCKNFTASFFFRQRRQAVRAFCQLTRTCNRILRKRFETKRVPLGRRRDYNSHSIDHRCAKCAWRVGNLSLAWDLSASFLRSERRTNKPVAGENGAPSKCHGSSIILLVGRGLMNINNFDSNEQW